MYFAIPVLLALFAAARQSAIPQQPPRGFGVAIGYTLGGARELDALGSVWYLDYDFRGAAIPNHRRFLLINTQANLASVPSVARADRGAWWQFGNEPNDPNQDNVSPAEYAARYHAFAATLAAADPAARIASAGIADADWRWADAFREAHRAQFGSYPRVDGWNIHNYLLDTCAGATDVAAFQARIVAFRDWMRRIGDDAKPLFLTEYGVLYGGGCCDCPPIPAADVIEFMRATTQWLCQTQAVQGWAWFAARTDSRFNGDLFRADGTFTEFGAAYSALMRTPACAEGGR